MHLDYDYPPKSMRKAAYLLLRAATIICIINFSALVFINNKFFIMFTMIFPCAIFAVNTLGIFATVILYLFKSGPGEDSRYIEETYPILWEKIRPYGMPLRNEYLYLRFVFGAYGDSGDPRIKAIKINEKDKYKYLLWVVLLTICSFCMNAAVIVYKGH